MHSLAGVADFRTEPGAWEGAHARCFSSLGAPGKGPAGLGIKVWQPREVATQVQALSASQEFLP